MSVSDGIEVIQVPANHAEMWARSHEATDAEIEGLGMS